MDRDDSATGPEQHCVAGSFLGLSVIDDRFLEAEGGEEEADGGLGVPVAEVWPEEWFIRRR